MGRRIVESPWVIVAADCIELPFSKNQYKYIFVSQDLFTSWVELKPLRAATGRNVKLSLEELVLFKRGALDLIMEMILMIMSWTVR